MQAALARSVSERHLQRSASPGAGTAFDLAAPNSWPSHPDAGSANGVQNADREQGAAAGMQPALEHSVSRAAAEADAASQQDRMAASDPADVNFSRKVPATAAAGASHDAGGGRTLEVRMVPATKEVRRLILSCKIRPEVLHLGGPQPGCGVSCNFMPMLQAS